MKKKYILPIVIAVVLIVSAIVGSVVLIYNANPENANPQNTETPNNVQQSATAPVHTHSFSGEETYKIVDGKVYVNYSCRDSSCSAIGEDRPVNNAIIVTPATIQNVLDGVVDNKIIVLTSGRYEYIEFRPTKETVSKISVDEYGGTNFGEPIFERGEGEIGEISLELINDPQFNYLYERKIQNVKIVGTEGVVLKNKFAVVSGEVNYLSLLPQDPIRGVHYNTDSAKHTTKLFVSNLTIQNLSFDGGGGILQVSSENENCADYDGITIERCSFVKTHETKNSGVPAVKIENAKNIVCVKNTVDGHFQGFYTINGIHISYIENLVKNTNSNAFSFQTTDSTTYFSGKINIVSNRVENILGTKATKNIRAIQFHIGREATIVVENNTFVNAVDSSGNVAKATELTNSIYSFINNNYFDSADGVGRPITNIASGRESYFSINVNE